VIAEARPKRQGVKKRDLKRGRSEAGVRRETGFGDPLRDGTPESVRKTEGEKRGGP